MRDATRSAIRRGLERLPHGAVPAEVEAGLERLRPSEADGGKPASGGALWNLNKDGLLHRALVRQSQVDEEGGAGLALPRETPMTVISRLTAWEVMADDARARARSGGAE
ncbi:MAG TPA: hypothetical protein VG265_13460 [Gaiellaceae bacterium]|jgi:hypothetical protein|nr:hypothetical protein [Gaiellaceae bacterium]